MRGRRFCPAVFLLVVSLLTPLGANGQTQTGRRPTDVRQVGVVVWRTHLEIVFPPVPFATSGCDSSNGRGSGVLHMWNLSFDLPQPNRRGIPYTSHLMTAAVRVYVDSSATLTRRQVDSAVRVASVELGEGGGEAPMRMRPFRLRELAASWERDQVVLTASDSSAIMDFFSSRPTEVALSWCEHERTSSQVVPVDYRYPSPR